MRWINRAFEQSAYEWDLTSNAAWCLFWVPIVGSVLLIFAAVNRDLYRFLLAEDGPVEWLTFAGFVITAIIAARIAFLLFKASHMWLVAVYTLFTAAMLFCAGEEISWGQRIFSYEIPDTLRSLNPTNELVFHNIGGTFGFFNLAIIAVEFIGVIAFFINRRLHLEKRWTYANYLLIPPLCLSSSFFIAFAYNPIRFVLWPEPTSVVSRYSEWTELCLVFGLTVFVLLALRQLSENLPSHTVGPTLRLRNSE
jgi:hypothetical protein